MGRRGRKAQAVTRKRGGLTALAAHTFPRSVAWRVDQDYAEGLSPDERRWLAEFNDRYYGADFRGASQVDWTDEERKRAYRDKNAANRDLMTCDIPAHGLDVPEAVVELEDAPPVDDRYLDDPRYKSAREAYRADPSPSNRVRLNQARLWQRR